MKKKTMLMAVILISIPLLLWADAESEIDYLIACVRGSKATFIRNGQESTPNEAGDHLQKKREYFRKEIKTAEDFIQKAASKSSMTGKPYLMRTEDGLTVECSAWLLEELERFRKVNKGAANQASAVTVRKLAEPQR